MLAFDAMMLRGCQIEVQQPSQLTQPTHPSKQMITTLAEPGRGWHNGIVLRVIGYFYLYFWTAVRWRGSIGDSDRMIMMIPTPSLRVTKEGNESHDTSSIVIKY